MKPRIEKITDRIENAEPSKPRNQADHFSAKELAREMKETYDYLIQTHGPSSLTDQYGRDHSSEILEAIGKLEADENVNAYDSARELDEDSQVALARLIRAVETHTANKAERLRSAFNVRP